MQEVVEVLVRALVDHPDEVTVHEQSGRPGSIHVKVLVAPGDMGKVIGRQGKIAGAIRTVATGAGARHDLRVFVDFDSQG